MSKLEELKAATAALNPDDQMELFNWWIQTDALKTRQLAALKRELALGLEQLDQGRYQTHDDSNIMTLAEDIGRSGRERRKDGRKPSTP